MERGRRKTSMVVRPEGLVFLGALFLVSAALAASTGMPWESPLEKLVNSLSGPVSRAVGAFAIVGLGFGIATSEGGSWSRKALMVVLGLAVAFNAISWALPMLGFAGGLSV